MAVSQRGSKDRSLRREYSLENIAFSGQENNDSGFHEFWCYQGYGGWWAMLDFVTIWILEKISGRSEGIFQMDIFEGKSPLSKRPC